jgi:uracil-DNA glycosylase family 4
MMSQSPTLSSAGPLSGGEAAAALAALAWLVDAGVDTLVGNAPASWLAQAPPVPEPVTAEPPARPPRAAPAPVRDDSALLARIAGCATLDALAALVVEGGGRPALFADGNPASRVMVLGDMPTADDIAAGRLFAGASGQLLDRMLAAIGRDRADIYLANLLARPTPRTPDPAEIAVQLPVVRRQIELVRPHAVLVLGGVAAAALLNVETGINRLRGRWQSLETATLKVPVMPSFAPAYLLAHPSHKALAWRDLLLFKSALAAYTDVS